MLPWLAVRMSPWLIGVNLLCWATLLMTALALPDAGTLRTSALHHGARLARGTVGLAVGPAHLAVAGRSSLSSDRGRRVLAQAPAIAAGVGSLMFGLIVLASGDALLASFLDTGSWGPSLTGRIAAFVVGVVCFAVGVGAVNIPEENDAAPRSLGVSAMPALYAQLGLAVAIACYAASQLSAAALGAEFVTRRTGLSFAEYARAGFFQMVIIAAVALLAMTAGRSAIGAPDAPRRALRSAAIVLTLGTVLTVASAIVKLVIYADALGLTMLRIYTVVFAGWLAIAAVATLVALLRDTAGWLTPVLVAVATVVAFAMNVVNPDAVVARHNLDRAEVTGTLDVDHLASLSADAAPVILAHLDGLDAVTDLSDANRFDRTPAGLDAATELRRYWCREATIDRSSVWAFNRAAEQRDRARSAHCD